MGISGRFSKPPGADQLSKQSDEHASSNCGTDNAGHVGTHCVHQQEVAGIVFLTNLEPLGGGGNTATAGAQVAGSSVKDVLDRLVESIDKFYEIY